MSSVLYLAQQGRCFYCDKIMAPMKSNKDVQGWNRDHFVPLKITKKWSIELKFNFVLAHPKCNRKKADRFPTQLEVLKFKKLYRVYGFIQKVELKYTTTVHLIIGNIKMSNITLSDVLETIREELNIDGHINWEDFGELKLQFNDKSGELPCLSIYLGSNKESDTIHFDVGEDT